MLAEYLGTSSQSETERQLAERTLREEVEKELRSINEEHGKAYLEVFTKYIVGAV